MKNLRELKLVILPNGKIRFIPVDEIVQYQIIIPDEKLGICVYMKTNSGCASDGLGDEVVIREFTDEIRDQILSNDGKCYTEVDYKNELSLPSNRSGHKMIVLHLERPLPANVQEAFDNINNSTGEELDRYVKTIEEYGKM